MSLTQSQIARQERMLDVATRLAAAGGFDAVQMRTVALDADVALGTLYRYFPSKEQLYATVLVEWSAGFPTARRDASGDSDEERLRITLHRAVRAYERRPTFYRLITALQAVPDPAVVELFQRFSGQFEAAMLDALATTDERDARVVVAAAGAFLHARLLAWTRGLASLREVRGDLDDFVTVLFGGVR